MPDRKIKVVKIVIAGASFAGLCAVNRILAQYADQAAKLDITVIEPNTAFEYVTFSWEYISRNEQFWTVPITNYDHAIADIHTKTAEMFKPYTTMPFLNSDRLNVNFKMYHGSVTAMGSNTITFTSTQNATQPSPLPTPSPNNDYTIDYDILLNATGSIATQPIKSLSQNRSLATITTKFEKFTSTESIIAALHNIFTTNDITSIQEQFPPTFHTSLQSLLYLDGSYIKLLLDYFLPASLSADTIPFALRKAYVLTCFFLLSAPVELNAIIDKAGNSLLEGIYAPITALGSLSRPVDSILTRFVEMAAIRGMLLHREEEEEKEKEEEGEGEKGEGAATTTTTTATTATNPLPQIRVLNMVGAGPTSMEILGFYVDTLYNENQTKGEGVKSREQLDVNVYCLDKVLGVFPESVGVGAKAHFIQYYSPDIANFQFHEGTPWDPETPQKQLEADQSGKVKPGSIMNVYAFGFQKTPFSVLNTSDQLLTQESIDAVRHYFEMTRAEGPMPGVVFAFGDAWVKRGIGPTARIAHSQSNYVVDNMFIYINHFLKPVRKDMSPDWDNRVDVVDFEVMFNYHIANQMYSYPLPASPSFAVGTLGQFGGFFSAPHYNFGGWFPGMTKNVANMKANVRKTIMSVFLEEPTTSWASTKWNMIEFFSGYSDRWF